MEANYKQAEEACADQANGSTVVAIGLQDGTLRAFDEWSDWSKTWIPNLSKFPEIGQGFFLQECKPRTDGQGILKNARCYRGSSFPTAGWFFSLGPLGLQHQGRTWAKRPRSFHVSICAYLYLHFGYLLQAFANPVRIILVKWIMLEWWTCTGCIILTYFTNSSSIRVCRS